MFSKFLFFVAVIVCSQLRAFAQQDPIEKVWYNQEKTSKIHVYKAKDGRFYGKIVWLKEPVRNGKARVDEFNPEEANRNTPLIGLLILKGLEKDGDNEYHNGKIYDPKNGKTYSCRATLNGNVLNLRGFVGISLIGRTSQWTIAD
ncbi:MAG: DUF2147 domain-containing protein [Bacteroidetes bacterium]|nr:DUF2147 domain-containing protein [Bacteroidota bacterium]